MMGALAAIVLLGLPGYTTDEGARTGIRRLDWQHAVNRGHAEGVPLVRGGRWKGGNVKLRLTGQSPPPPMWPIDEELQAALRETVQSLDLDAYGIALLDITDPGAPRYAALHDDRAQTPGSIAKMLVAAAFLNEVSRRYPEVAERERFLRETVFEADAWCLPNHHDVPIVDAAGAATVRPIQKGDRFSAWEWLDHALSSSSNAAGSLLWREATLMRLMGERYQAGPRPTSFFASWGRKAFTQAAFDVVDAPLRDAGLSVDDFSLRLFFTTGASRFVGSAKSRVTPRALIDFWVAVESGRLIDTWASLEMKRLLYLTNVRRRMTAAPELNDYAAYSKSGSLYACKPERGYACDKFMGNKVNVLNSFASFETRYVPGKRQRVFMLAVVSNQLRRHAAKDHARLAGAIERAIAAKSP